MKHVRWLFLLIIILFTTGCWNYRELSEVSIVGAIGVDVVDNEFNISVEIINTKRVSSSNASGGNNSNESPVFIYETKGKTIREALTNMVYEAPSQLYIGHINLLVIGEEAAKKGITEFADFFMADTDSRKMFPTVVVRDGKAVDAMKILMPLEIVPSANIKASLDAIAEINGTLSNRLFDEIIMCLYMEGRNPTISAIKIVGDQKAGEKADNISNSKPKASVKIDGSAVLKGDKLVGYFNNKESLAYTIIRDHANTVDLSFPCDKKGNYGNVIINGVKGNLKVKLIKNKPVAEINVSGKADLPEFDCAGDITTSKGLAKVAKMADKELKKIIEKTIEKGQKELKSDVFGFGERLYKENNKYWEKNKKNWDTIFQSTNYKVKVNIAITNVDATVESAKDVYNGRKQ